jgi:hypothetical protein
MKYVTLTHDTTSNYTIIEPNKDCIQLNGGYTGEITLK